jgi:hypothetical protein
MNRHQPLPARNRNCHLPLVIVVALVVVFYWDYLLSRSYIWNDALQLVFPWVHYFASAIRAGRFPLWFSGVCDGVPFYSDVQTGVFYPPTWVLVLFANSGQLPVQVYQWFLVLHVLMGGGFMFWFLRDYELRPPSLLTGSVVFCFAGFMSLHIIHPNIILGYAWLPGQLLFVKRLLATRSAKYFGYLVGASLLSFLGGHQQIFLYGSYFVASFWLFSWWRQLAEKPGRLRGAQLVSATREVLKVGAVFLCTFLLAAIFVLPVAENWYKSARQGMGWKEAAKISLPIRGLITLVVPNFFGRASDHGSLVSGGVLVSGSASPASEPDSSVPFWGVVKDDLRSQAWAEWQYQYWETGAYAGQLSLIALLVFLFNWKQLPNRAAIGFFVAVCGLAIWFMLGSNGGLFNLLYCTLPGVSSFRTPTRMACVFDCAAAVLVAFLVDAVATGEKLGLRNTAFVLVAGYVSLIFGTRAFGDLVFAELNEDVARAYTIKQMYIGAGFAIVSFVLVYALTRLTGWKRQAVLGCLPLLVAADLFVAFGEFHRGKTDPAFYYADRVGLLPRLRQLNEEIGPFRFAQLGDGRLVEDIVYPKNFAYMHTGIEYPGGYISFPLQDGGAFQAITNQRAKIDIQNIKVTEDVNLASHWAETTIHSNALPRVKFYREIKPYESNAALLSDLSAGTIDYNNEIAVLASSGLTRTPSTPNNANDSVQLTRHSPERYTIRYSVGSPGVIFVSESYYPGWKTSDPQFKIVKAFGAFKGIVVPEAGAGELIVRFAPDSLRVGSIISVVSGTLLLGVLIVVSRRSKHRESRQHEADKVAEAT